MKKSQCRYCGALMKGRQNKLYCSDICRAKSWREGGTYVAPCVYCGIPADTIDHVPPRSVRPSIVAMGIVSRYPFVEVDACRECNSVLGARALWTVADRKRFIKSALRRRYAKYLRIPDWSAAEVESMGRGVLGKFIERGIIIRDLVNERIKW